MSDPSPAELVHPGVVLKRELDARGWTQKDLAEIIDRPVQAITEIIRGTKQITPETAVELGAALGTPPDLWTSLETTYRLQLARRKHSSAPEISERAKIFDRLPVSEMIRRDWIKGSRDVHELKKQALTFLGVSSIEEDPKLFVSLRRSASTADVEATQRAWVRRVEIVAAKQRLKERFTVGKLKAALPDLRRFARTEEAVASVPPLLNSLGVRFTIVASLPKARIDGAALVSPDGPIVALSLRYDRIDWFWFTLMHEVAHLALAHKGGHLDQLESPDMKGSDEQAANSLAEDCLLSREKFRNFVSHHGRALSKADVEDFARQEEVHPSIVVGRLHFEKVLPWSHMRGYLAKVSPHLRPWFDTASEKSSRTAKSEAI